MRRKIRGRTAGNTQRVQQYLGVWYQQLDQHHYMFIGTTSINPAKIEMDNLTPLRRVVNMPWSGDTEFYRTLISCVEHLRVDNKSWFDVPQESVMELSLATSCEEVQAVLMKVSKGASATSSNLSALQRDIARLVQEEGIRDVEVISKRLLCAKSMVYSWLKRLGLSPSTPGKEKKQTFQKDRYRKFCELREQHKDWSLRKLAGEAGCAVSTSSRWLKELGGKE